MSRKGANEICPVCGFNNSSYTAPQKHLRPGTVLNEKYAVGRAVSGDESGIDYIGYDMKLETRVTIREYFPEGLVSRDFANTDTVTIFSGPKQNVYEAGKKQFINGAKVLAGITDAPAVAPVKDIFMENGTAYIVTEYIEGKTFTAYLAQSGGRIPSENIFMMMKPLILSLAQIHRKGIIHGNITPDNIIITANSQVKLINFALSLDNGGSQPRTCYAPEEKYKSSGVQGSWTDVYALCAVIYRAITGVEPVEALARINNDRLMRPSQMRISVSPAREQALIHGMSIYANQRIQDMDTLYNAFYKNTAVYARPNNTYSPQPQSSSNAPLIAVAIVCAVLVLGAAAFLVYTVMNNNKTEKAEPTPAPVATVAPTPVPAPVMTRTSASSTRGTDTEGGQYSTEAVLSPDPMTKWVPSKSYGSGIGQWIQVYADTDQYVKGVKILNGYHKSPETWVRNNRVRHCTLTFSNGESRVFELQDTMDMITIDLGTTIRTSYVRLTIESIYSGTQWDDTAVTYLGVY